jgi:hypothetical protein
LTIDDETDRANEDFKKKEDRRQQKLMMKNKLLAAETRKGAMDALVVIKKIVSEMPEAVLQSAEEKHKSNPFNVRINVDEVAARMEEVAQAERSLVRRRKQVVENSDDSENEEAIEQPPSPTVKSLKAGERLPFCRRFISLTPEVAGVAVDENGEPLPQKTFTMILDGKEVCFLRAR